jgi:forkhead transcription factor HCM1
MQICPQSFEGSRKAKPYASRAELLTFTVEGKLKTLLSALRRDIARTIMGRPPRVGGSEPLHIFQDEYYQPHNSHNTTPMPQSTKPRQPLQAADRNVVLNPPSFSSAKQGPFKSTAKIGGLQPRTPLKTAKGENMLHMVHMAPPTSQTRSTDSLTKKQPPMSRFKTVAQKPTQDMSSTEFAGKENSHATIYPAPPALNFSMETFVPKGQGKRMLLEAAPIKELRPAKKPKLEEFPLPPSESFAMIIDDGSKPGHSYAQLIGMAILRSPQRRLTLAQIYKWISDTFSFYNANDAGWQNSIRHNLSLNKHFIKQERPKNDPGKGNYWMIEPGQEMQFMKEKPTRKPPTTAENLPVMSTRLEPQPLPQQSQQPQLPQYPHPQLAPPPPPAQHLQQHHQLHHPQQVQTCLYPPPIQPPQLPVCESLPPLPSQHSQPAADATQPELSSDATIPMPSDNAAVEDITENQVEDETNDVDLYSPLPVAMHSSPPVPRHVEVDHSQTPPPPILRHNGSSGIKSRSHKRRLASMNDSGYISSLESSAMRPNPHNRLLTSEADRPRIKRGRAEEEIARLRSSSYDSPSKTRSWNGFAANSSSPMRNNSPRAGQMLPPLTPAMKLKAPPKPPPSVSPNTNLRIHRQNVQSMIESPYRRVSHLLPRDDAALQLTPGLKVEEVFYGIDRKSDDFLSGPSDFDIFPDSNPFAPFLGMSPLNPTNFANGSPAKRSVKRPRLDRSRHSTSALGEVSNSASNAMLSNFLKVPDLNLSLAQETPSKVFHGLPSSPFKLFMQSPSKMPSQMNADVENMEPWISFDDMATGEFPGEFLEEDDFGGIDMLAGFEKIGSNHSSSQPQLRLPKQAQKPGLGRSHSTFF